MHRCWFVCLGQGFFFLPLRGSNTYVWQPFFHVMIVGEPREITRHTRIWETPRRMDKLLKSRFPFPPPICTSRFWSITKKRLFSSISFIFTNPHQLLINSPCPCLLIVTKHMMRRLRSCRTRLRKCTSLGVRQPSRTITTVGSEPDS